MLCIFRDFQCGCFTRIQICLSISLFASFCVSVCLLLRGPAGVCMEVLLSVLVGEAVQSMLEALALGVLKDVSAAPAVCAQPTSAAPAVAAEDTASRAAYFLEFLLVTVGVSSTVLLKSMMEVEGNAR